MSSSIIQPHTTAPSAPWLVRSTSPPTQNQRSTHSSAESYRIDIDNSDSPTAVLVHPRGDWLFTALQGNDHVATFDRLRLLNNPAALAPKSTTWRIGNGNAHKDYADEATDKLFVKNFTARTVSVQGPLLLPQSGDQSSPTVASVETVTNEALSDQVLLGKQLFYLAGTQKPTQEDAAA